MPVASRGEEEHGEEEHGETVQGETVQGEAVRDSTRAGVGVGERLTGESEAGETPDAGERNGIGRGDVGRDVGRELGRELGREIGREAGREAGRELVRDVGLEGAADPLSARRLASSSSMEASAAVAASERPHDAGGCHLRSRSRASRVAIGTRRSLRLRESNEPTNSQSSGPKCLLSEPTSISDVMISRSRPMRPPAMEPSGLQY